MACSSLYTQSLQCHAGKGESHCPCKLATWDSIELGWIADMLPFRMAYLWCTTKLVLTGPGLAGRDVPSRRTDCVGEEC